MPINDIILSEDPSWSAGDVHEKVLRLRAVKDNGKIPMGGDELFMDILLVSENFTTSTYTAIGALDSTGSPMSNRTTEEKCIGSFVINLDDIMEALDLLKRRGQ